MKRRRTRGLSEEEARLWAGVARQAKPLRGKAVPEELKETAPKSLSKGAMERRMRRIPPSVLPDISPSRGEIDPDSMQDLLDGVSDHSPPEKRLISPLEGEMPAGRGGLFPAPPPIPPKPLSLMPAYKAPSPNTPLPALHPIEKPVKRKIAKGRVAIDDRIDLHDKTQIVAHYALLGFLRQAQASGLRHVLVITGRGASLGSPSFGTRGVIRRTLPHWFGTAEFRALVAGFEPAERHHGGDGAFYVRIRRR